MKKIIIPVSIVIIAIIGFILLLPNDDEKIRATVKKGKEAVEEENLSKIMSIFSIEYRDRYGLPYGTIRGAFNDLFARSDNIQIHYTLAEVAIANDTSKVLMEVRATGAVSGIRRDIVGDEDEAGRLELILIKKYVKWLIISSEWKNPQAVKGIDAMPYIPHFNSPNTL